MINLEIKKTLWSMYTIWFYIIIKLLFYKIYKMKVKIFIYNLLHLLDYDN